MYEDSLAAYERYNKSSDSVSCAQYAGVPPTESQEPDTQEYKVEEAVLKSKLERVKKAIPLLHAVKETNTDPIPNSLLNLSVDDDPESASDTPNPSSEIDGNKRKIMGKKDDGESSQTKKAKGASPGGSPSFEAQQQVVIWDAVPQGGKKEEDADSMTSSDLIRNI